MRNHFRVVAGDSNVGAHGDGFSALFSRERGGLTSLQYGGQEVLRAAPQLTFWRAPTDNDRAVNFGYERGAWKLASLYPKLTGGLLEDGGDKLTIVNEFDLPTHPASKSAVRYEVSADGVIHVTASFQGAAGLPGFPLFGMNFPLLTCYEHFRFHGNGPEENYIDRCSGAKYGVYESTARANLSRYLKPQECGNRTGMTRLEAFSGSGGVCFYADRPFEGGVLPYSEHELENAPNKPSLPKPYATWARVLAAQMGVGGDDSWGAPVHDEYMLSAEKDWTFRFSVAGI